MIVIVLLKFGKLVMEGTVYCVPFYANVKEHLLTMWNLVLILTYKTDGNGFLFHLKQYSFIFTVGMNNEWWNLRERHPVEMIE
jgi:hypothetical protein